MRQSEPLTPVPAPDAPPSAEGAAERLARAVADAPPPTAEQTERLVRLFGSSYA